jgi:hypothetical protein
MLPSWDFSILQSVRNNPTVHSTGSRVAIASLGMMVACLKRPSYYYLVLDSSALISNVKMTKLWKCKYMHFQRERLLFFRLVWSEFSTPYLNATALLEHKCRTAEKFGCFLISRDSFVQTLVCASRVQACVWVSRVEAFTVVSIIGFSDLIVPSIRGLNMRKYHRWCLLCVLCFIF